MTEQMVEEVRPRLTLTRMIPNEDPSLAYQLVLPTGWLSSFEARAGEGGIGVEQSIGLFLPCRHPDAPSIRVGVIFLPVEVDLVDWVRFHLARMGWVRLREEWIVRSATARLRVIARRVKPGNQLLDAVFFIDHGRIFVVHGRSPATRAPEIDAAFSVARGSFELLRPTGVARLEQHDGVELEDDAGHFELPSSWAKRLVRHVAAYREFVFTDAKLGLTGHLWVSRRKIELRRPDVASASCLDDLRHFGGECLAREHILVEDSSRPHVPGTGGQRSSRYAEFCVGYHTRRGEPHFVLRGQCRCRNGWVNMVATAAVPHVVAPRSYSPYSGMMWMRTRRAFDLALTSFSFQSG
jgi:hypothetical protein